MKETSTWRPTASLEHIQLRARIYRRIRDYFAEQRVIEVETPILSIYGNSDPYIDSLVSRVHAVDNADGLSVYLHTSPEFAMKRLLAAGTGSLYQIARVFRQGEVGSHHRQEFTLLEWYRLDYDHHRLMDEVEELVARLLALDCAAYRISYTDCFQRFLHINLQQISIQELMVCAERQGINVNDLGDDRDQWLDLLLSHIIQPQLKNLARMVFVYDYPSSQAALARINEQGMAERFELYLDGIELANGYHELSNAAEQGSRFNQDNARRRLMGKTPIPLDKDLLAALESGLPDCAGVALGLDRLLMCAAGVENIQQVIAFPILAFE